MFIIYFLVAWIIMLLLFFVPFIVHKIVYRNKQAKINRECINYLGEINFNIDNTICLCDSNTANSLDVYKKSIYIDNEKKKICLVNYEVGSWDILSFSDIVNYEIYDNNKQSTSGAAYKWGKKGKLTTFDSVSIERCKDLRLLIRVKNCSTFQYSYELSRTFLNLGMNKAKKLYNLCISSMQEAVSFLEVITTEN